MKGTFSPPALQKLQEQGLEVLSECNGYDGEVGAEGEDGKEGQVVAQDCQYPVHGG